MAESRQQKAKRLVVEHFNEHLQTPESGEADPDELGILWHKPLDEKGWFAVVVMKKPIVMYWEVRYAGKGAIAGVKPFGALPMAYYPDVPARRKVKEAV